MRDADAVPVPPPCVLTPKSRVGGLTRTVVSVTAMACLRMLCGVSPLGVTQKMSCFALAQIGVMCLKTCQIEPERPMQHRVDVC